MTTTQLQLSAGQATATLLPGRGGLLSQLALENGRGTTTSVLWMPSDFDLGQSGWPGGGLPLCFPFAGRVFHQGQPFQYEIGGRVHLMPLHGFAHGLPWTPVATPSPARAELALSDGPATHELYPFRFRVKAAYDLTPTTLGMRFTVTHVGPLAGDGRMPVALGLHPYFRAPLGIGGDLAHCRLETSAQRKYPVTPLGGAGKAAPFPPPAAADETPADAAERRGELATPGFSNLILGHLTKPEVALVDRQERLAVELSWTEDKSAASIGYIVLWSKPGQGFHCIEPWMGLPDAVNNGQGIAWLSAGESLTLSFQLRVTARV